MRFGRAVHEFAIDRNFSGLFAREGGVVRKHTNDGLRQAVREVQAWMNVLEIADDRLAAELVDLDNEKWARIRDERDAGKPHGVMTEDGSEP